jgi:hypothetical protein
MISDGHATAKMGKSIIITDGQSAGMQFAQFRQEIVRQIG